MNSEELIKHYKNCAIDPCIHCFKLEDQMYDAQQNTDFKGEEE